MSYSQVYDRFLHALVTEADSNGIRVILYKTDSQQDEIRQFEALTARGDVEAFVLTDTTHNDPRLEWCMTIISLSSCSDGLGAQRICTIPSPPG